MNTKQQKIKNISNLSTEEDPNLKDSKNEFDVKARQKNNDTSEEEINHDQDNKKIEEACGNNSNSEEETKREEESLNYEEKMDHKISAKEWKILKEWIEKYFY